MTENQKFKPGERVWWDSFGMTWSGIVQDGSFRQDSGSQTKRAIGWALVLVDGRGISEAGWIDSAELRRHL